VDPALTRTAARTGPLLGLVRQPLERRQGSPGRVEEAIGTRGRPRWIAYRMILPDSTTLHLDVSARGDYDTGVFAYNFIRRGERYGLRIVGSLKSKPALNVLAAYEV